MKFRNENREERKEIETDEEHVTSAKGKKKIFIREQSVILSYTSERKRNEKILQKKSLKKKKTIEECGMFLLKFTQQQQRRLLSLTLFFPFSAQF